MVTGDTLTLEFVLQNPTTMAASNADSTPVGVLVVNSVDSAAVVTVTNKTTGVYTASVTMPAISAGDMIALRVTATVGGITGTGIIWQAENAVNTVGAGSGIGYYSDTVEDNQGPLDGVRVQLYTGSSRSGLAYQAYTNASGVFEMWPDPGTYYRWLDLAGYVFDQDVEVVVTEL